MNELEKVVVTKRPGSPLDGAVVSTPPGMADVKIVALTWLQQAGIRTARTYLQTMATFLLAGFASSSVQSGLEITANAVGVRVPVGDFAGLFVAAASLAVGPAVIALIQNAIEILAKLDNPKTRA